MQWPIGQYNWVDFNTEPPTSGKGPQYSLGNPPTAITDSAGRLIMCSDLCYLWGPNKQGLKLKNGLHYSNPQQAGACIPDPDMPGYYTFLYTGDRAHMSLQNTLFSVCAVRVNPYKIDTLYIPEIILNRPCTKLTVVKRQPEGYWVIARYKDTVYSIPYSHSGFGKAIKNTIELPSQPNASLEGHLKASHDSKTFIEFFLDNQTWRLYYLLL
jgi:hypothetical protein